MRLKINFIIMTFYFCFSLFGVVNAEPFLVCDDPDPSWEVTSCIITFANGNTEEVPVPLRYDLSELESQTYVVQVQFKNIWGVGPMSVPFEFTKQLPASPTNIRLSE